MPKKILNGIVISVIILIIEAKSTTLIAPDTSDLPVGVVCAGIH